MTENEHYPLSDWQYEVTNGDTRLGYEDWVQHKYEADCSDLDDDYPPPCTDPGGHKFECTGTEYGGDDERWHGEGRCLCIHCGADGDA